MADTFPDLAGLKSTDISVQVLSSLFGEGWHDLSSLAASGSGAVLGDLLFTLFNVLNCCCAIVVAWLFILTTLAATLGAAQDGRGIAGLRYSNAWIPLRYSFAMGAITPVFSGLNAMQIIMLSCISLSVQFADTMWETGLEHLGKTGSVAARAEPAVAGSASQVLPVLIEHHVLRSYFEKTEMCAVATAGRKRSEDWSLNRYVVSFELPYLMNCPNLRGDDGFGVTLNPALDFGDFGQITVSTPIQEASQALAEVLAPSGSLYKQTQAAVNAALAASDEDRYAAAGISALARSYQQTVAAALKQAAARVEERRAAMLEDFTAQAATGGWWLAGSYYWTLARMAADAVEAMQDRTTARPVNLEALSEFMNPDLERSIQLARELSRQALVIATEGDGTSNPLTGAALVNGQAREAEQASDLANTSVLAGLTGFFSGAAHAISEFALDDTALAGGVISVIEGHDLVFNVVKASRTLMNVCENAVVTYMSLKLFGHSFSFFSKNPVTGVVVSAAEDILDLVGKIALAIAAPLWLVAWFYAYMLPMLPFIAWFTAIIGWLVLCLEAIAACPLWLIAHCMPDGDGFAGASARAGYALFLSVLLRPLLLVLSFFMCMAIMSVSGSFMGALLIPFFDAQGGAFAVGGFGTSGWGVTASITTVLLVGFVTGIATWKLFTLITMVPDRIIRWAGQLVASLGDFHAEAAIQQGKASMDATAGRMLPSIAAGSAIGAVAGIGAASARRHNEALRRELAQGKRQDSQDSQDSQP